MDPIIGAALVNGAFKMAGGVANWFSGNSSQRKEYERQKEFLQNGIQWRVEDAKKAGIHPLYAIGASTGQYSPQSVVGSDFGLGEMGQSISDSVKDYVKKNSPEQKFENWAGKTDTLLTIRGKELENERTQAEIDQTRQQIEASRKVLNNQPGNPIVPPSSQPGYLFDEGRIKVNPSEVESSMKGHPNVGAAPFRSVRYVHFADGSVKPYPTQEISDFVSESYPSLIQWYAEQWKEGIPDSELPKDAVGWKFNPLTGVFKPVYMNEVTDFLLSSPFFKPRKNMKFNTLKRKY